MDQIEQVARAICEWRGVPPDAPVTIGNPDGTSEYFETAWLGYVGIAEQIIDLITAS